MSKEKANLVEGLFEDLKDIQNLIKFKKNSYKTSNKTDDLRDLDRLISLECKIIDQIKRVSN